MLGRWQYAPGFQLFLKTNKTMNTKTTLTLGASLLLVSCASRQVAVQNYADKLDVYYQGQIETDVSYRTVAKKLVDDFLRSESPLATQLRTEENGNFAYIDQYEIIGKYGGHDFAARVFGRTATGLTQQKYLYFRFGHTGDTRNDRGMGIFDFKASNRSPYRL